MPSVPDYGQRQVRKEPLPSARKQAHETVESQGGAIGEALAGFGHVGVQITARGVAEITERERTRADEIAQLGALRELSDWKRQRLFAADGGALQTRGKDSFGLPETLTGEFDEVAGRIRGGLSNDRQRSVVERAIASERDSVLLAVHRHVADQRRAYDEAEFTGFIDNQHALVSLQAADPFAVNAALMAAVTETEAFGRRNGKGAEAIAHDVATVRNVMWEGAIKQAIADGADRVAVAYFDEARDAGQLSGPVLTRVAEMVKNAATDAEAERAAAQIWLRLGPADDDDPIELDRLEAAAREQFGEDPTTLKATIAALRSRKQGVDDARQERREAAEGAVWGKVFDGLSLEQLRRTPEFVAAPGRLQVQVRDYFRQESDRLANRAYTLEARDAAREQRLVAAEARRERELEMAGWGAYFDLSKPETLRGTSRAAILAQLPVLGHAHVARLLTDQEQLLRSDATFREATIDADLFAEVARNAGLAYVDAPTKTKEQKANLGRLQALVEDTIARQQIGGQRKLSRDETRAVMQGIVDQKVTLDVGFWYDRDQIAALVNPDDASKAYVPIASITDTKVIEDAANVLRGEYPWLANTTTADIKAKYARQIERAYALRLMGRPRADIEAALKGK